jgi:predicted dehydrogenase
VGIVGAGFMGVVHAAAWAATDATVTGVLPGPATPREQVTDRLGLPVYPDLPALLGDVDVVDVCAPTDVHHELVLAAAAAGRNVICEKPLARTVAQGEAMVAACRDAAVTLLVGHVVRFFPEYAATKAAVDRGDVGTPAVLRLSRSSFQPRRPTDSFADPGSAKRSGGPTASNWYLDEARSGGLVLDLMIHDLDFARWVAGDVASVYAKRVRSAHAAAQTDHALAILRHRNGALSHVEASWAHPPPVFRTSGEIAGTTGLLTFDSDASAPVRTFLVRRSRSGAAAAEAGDVGLPSSPLREAPHTTQIRHFADVLRGDAEPIVSARDGLEALRLAAAAAESTRTGQPALVSTGRESSRILVPRNTRRTGSAGRESGASASEPASGDSSRGARP